MVAQVINKERAKFRIIVREIKTGKSRTLSLTDSDSSIDDIKKEIEKTFVSH